MTAADDKILYGGGGEVITVLPNGMDFDVQYVAPQILLSNQFELVVVAPKELSPEQEEPAFLATFKGRDNGSKAMGAVTVVFTAEMAHALFKSLNLKWRELPIEFR